jgi:PadR family transcriptional regulator PadR
MGFVRNLNITPKMAEVLKIFLEDPAKPRYGFEIMQRAGLQSGSLYPLLAKLEEAGWLTGERETIDPHAAGRPPRRTYTLVGEAAVVAHDRLEALSEQYRPPELSPRRLRLHGSTAW